MAESEFRVKTSSATSIAHQPLALVNARLIDPGLTIAINFVLFLAVLLIRPAGLFGRSAS